MSTTASYPKREVLWRFKDSRSQSVSSERQDQQYCGFGWDAPIIDFYEKGYITEFAPLSLVLRDGPEKVMAAAFARMEEKQFQRATPDVGGRGRRRMRWIHIPANNMEWVERVIKCVWRAKKLDKARREEQKTSDDASDSSLDAVSEGDDMADIDDEYPMCLRPEYWRDQQRGRIEHCASHPLYARHMVPFFAPIPSSVESATASKLEPKPKLKSRRKSARVEENSRHHETAQKANMVLFMPYIHWATSGNLMTERNTLIRMLAKAFKSEDYCRPTEEEVNDLNVAPKLKIMKAFLFPENDRCLHIRRTLDQFYYSTLPQAMVDERTNDKVVYRFAKKQQLKRVEELRLAKKQILKYASKEDRGASFRESSSQKTGNINVEEIEEFLEQQKDSDEPPWDPPKVMMVNQLWMWVIDGDTVVTSFPAKLKSDLDHFKEKAEGKPLDGKDSSDYTKGDKIYDSTDIWRAVFREFRFNTEHGKRSQKSALDLAWTIADQAAGVFHKRNIHPHLQFIEMFDMEINEIAFKQAEAFDTFITNVQLAHTANEIGKVLSSLDFFQKEMFAIKHVPDWRAKFRELSRYFKRKLEYIVTCTDLKSNPNESTREVGTRIYVPPSPDEENERRKKTFSEELSYEYHQYAELLENSRAMKAIATSLDSAKADLGTSMDAVGSCIRESDTTEDEIDSVYAHLDHALQTLEDVGQSLKIKLVNLQRAENHLDYAISSLNTTKENFRSDTTALPGTI